MAGEKSEGVKLWTYSLLTQTGSSLVVPGFIVVIQPGS